MNVRLTTNLETLNKLYSNLEGYHDHFYHAEATEYTIRLQGILATDLEDRLLELGFKCEETNTDFVKYFKSHIKINLEVQ